MRINYKILWIDDQINGFLNRKDDINSYIKNMGFNPIINYYSGIQQVENEREDYNKYDLIISDFGLKKGVEGKEDETGADFIDLIRKRKVYTETILYSANNIPDKEIVEKYGYLDRVTVHRGAIRDLNDTICSLIDITVKKTLDITSLRGLIMSETTSIDASIERMLNNLYKHKELDGHVNPLIEDISNYIEASKVKSLKELKTKRAQNKYKDIVENYNIFTATHKYSLLRKIIKLLPDENGFFSDIDNKIKNYGKIIEERNDFGHHEEIINEEGLQCLKTKGKIKREIDEEYCLKLRKEIRNYYNAFEELEKEINERCVLLKKENFNVG